MNVALQYNSRLFVVIQVVEAIMVLAALSTIPAVVYLIKLASASTVDIAEGRMPREENPE